MGKNIYRTWALAGWLQVGPDGFGIYSRFGAARRVKKLRLGCSRNSPAEEPHFGQDMYLDKIMKGLCSYLISRLARPESHILRWFLSDGRTHRPAVVKGSSFSVEISRIFENTIVI